MLWVKVKRLLSAVLLSVALYQFVLLGTYPGAGAYIGQLLLCSSVLGAAVTIGCLARPRRAARAAAIYGGVGMFCVGILLNIRWSSAYHFVMRVVAGVSVREALSQVSLGLPDLAGPTGPMLLFLVWATALPAAVASWAGAKRWASESWGEFWRGPAGAVLKGAALGGVCAVALREATWYAIIRPQAEAAAAASSALTLVATPWWRHVISNMASVASAATVTWLLLPWKPRPYLGALAGSGMITAVFGISLAMNAIAATHVGPTSFPIPLILSHLLVSIVLGAVAGSFSGKWEEPTV